ncbi:zinc metalloprotease [Alphaproteobacteria bacterium]|nr:zinc metalloprotease [Alphaproteobacteria bacterium]GHS96018.1 zinc metalloprotease [Alphaproteobacteria bacterium]
MQGIVSALPFFIVLTTIVFIHELGHFLIARHYNVQVKTFSIGFGPKLFGWTDKKGTQWRLSAFPLGGYVMMLGDADASSTRAKLDGLDDDAIARTLTGKTPFQRMMVAFGGPLFNILLTLLLFAGIGRFKGIPDMVPRVQEVLAHSLASKAGLKKGDIISGVNDIAVTKVSEMKKALKSYSGQDATLHYKRGGKSLQSAVALYETKADGQKTPLSLLGVTLNGNRIYEKVSVLKALGYGATYCYEAARGLLVGLGRTISGQKDGAKLGSFLMIGDGAQKSFSSGGVDFLLYMAMISFSLGFINLFPIPVLDGGNILLNFIEIVIRRPLSSVFVNIVSLGGVGLVAALMMWSVWNDLDRYGVIKGIVDFFKKLFH